jgi:hypothetical protein
MQRTQWMIDDCVARLREIRNNLTIIAAHIENILIIAANKRTTHIPTQYRPLQKVVSFHNLSIHAMVLMHIPKNPGDGFALAQQILPPNVEMPAPVASAPIGAVPPLFNPNPSTYTHLDIINMVIFYNDNFGILAAYDCVTRQDLVRRWLTEL